MKRTPIQERFWANVQRAGPDECWLWAGYKDSKGYGRVGLGGRHAGMTGAHRISLKLFGVPVPDGLHVLHRCDVPACVNPRHLFVGTQADNIRDCVAKGRHKSHLPPTTPELVAKRKRSGHEHWNFGNRKEVCKSGHELSGDNAIIGSDGYRRCRTCKNAHALAAFYRKRSKNGALTISGG